MGVNNNNWDIIGKQSCPTDREKLKREGILIYKVPAPWGASKEGRGQKGFEDYLLNRSEASRKDLISQRNEGPLFFSGDEPKILALCRKLDRRFPTGKKLHSGEDGLLQPYKRRRGEG